MLYTLFIFEKNLSNFTFFNDLSLYLFYINIVVFNFLKIIKTFIEISCKIYRKFVSSYKK